MVTFPTGLRLFYVHTVTVGWVHRLRLRGYIAAVPVTHTHFTFTTRCRCRLHTFPFCTLHVYADTLLPVSPYVTCRVTVRIAVWFVAHVTVGLRFTTFLRVPLLHVHVYAFTTHRLFYARYRLPRLLPGSTQVVTRYGSHGCSSVYARGVYTVLHTVLAAFFAVALPRLPHTHATQFGSVYAHARGLPHGYRVTGLPTVWFGWFVYAPGSGLRLTILPHAWLCLRSAFLLRSFPITAFTFTALPGLRAYTRSCGYAAVRTHTAVTVYSSGCYRVLTFRFKRFPHGCGLHTTAFTHGLRTFAVAVARFTFVVGYLAVLRLRGYTGLRLPLRLRFLRFGSCGYHTRFAFVYCGYVRCCYFRYGLFTVYGCLRSRTHLVAGCTRGCVPQFTRCCWFCRSWVVTVTVAVTAHYGSSRCSLRITAGYRLTICLRLHTPRGSATFTTCRLRSAGSLVGSRYRSVRLRYLLVLHTVPLRLFTPFAYCPVTTFYRATHRRWIAGSAVAVWFTYGSHAAVTGYYRSRRDCRSYTTRFSRRLLPFWLVYALVTDYRFAAPVRLTTPRWIAVPFVVTFATYTLRSLPAVTATFRCRLVPVYGLRYRGSAVYTVYGCVAWLRFRLRTTTQFFWLRYGCCGSRLHTVGLLQFCLVGLRFGPSWFLAYRFITTPATRVPFTLRLVQFCIAHYHTVLRIHTFTRSRRYHLAVARGVAYVCLVRGYHRAYHWHMPFWLRFAAFCYTVAAILRGCAPFCLWLHRVLRTDTRGLRLPAVTRLVAFTAHHCVLPRARGSFRRTRFTRTFAFCQLRCYSLRFTVHRWLPFHFAFRCGYHTLRYAVPVTVTHTRGSFHAGYRLFTLPRFAVYAPPVTLVRSVPLAFCITVDLCLLFTHNVQFCLPPTSAVRVLFAPHTRLPHGYACDT